MRHRTERLNEVRAALESGARTADEVVAIVYAQTPQDLLGAAKLSVQAQMDYLTP
jgi:hypothetical protein